MFRIQSLVGVHSRSMLLTSVFPSLPLKINKAYIFLKISKTLIIWKIAGESPAGLNRNEEPSLKTIRATWSHEITSPSSPLSIINSNKTLTVIKAQQHEFKRPKNNLFPNKKLNPASTKKKASILLSKPIPRA